LVSDSLVSCRDDQNENSRRCICRQRGAELHSAAIIIDVAFAFDMYGTIGLAQGDARQSSSIRKKRHKTEMFPTHKVEVLRFNFNEGGLAMFLSHQEQRR